MASKKKASESPTLAEILEKRDPELRESFFKSETSSSNRSDKFKSQANAFASNVLFKTKKSTAISVAIITFILTLSVSSLFAPNTMDSTTLAAKISGGVALSEGELKTVVKQIGQKVYWVGPMSGAKYTINAQNFNSIYVRYLANGKGISDQTPKYRVIATYKESNGYNSTLSAGNQADGLSFTNPNGSAVYYNKQVPTNVYVAFKGKPYQIEIFDPNAKTALDLAKSDNAVRLIG